MNQTFENSVQQILAIINNYVVRGILIAGTIILIVVTLINWIKYGKAEDGEPKTKAKKSLISTGIACVGLFASIWILPLFFDFLIQIMPADSIKDPTNFVAPFFEYLV